MEKMYLYTIQISDLEKRLLNRLILENIATNFAIFFLPIFCCETFQNNSIQQSGFPNLIVEHSGRHICVVIFIEYETVSPKLFTENKAVKENYSVTGQTAINSSYSNVYCYYILQLCH